MRNRLHAIGAAASALMAQQVVVPATVLTAGRWSNAQTFRHLLLASVDVGTILVAGRWTNTQTFRSLVLDQEAPTSDPHQHWRINILSNNGDAFVGVTELEFRGEAFGPNLAVGGTASASSSAGGFPASDAFDSSLMDHSGGNDAWATNGTSTGWLAYDFGTPVDVNEIVVYNRGDGTYAAQSPQDFYIESSDDGSTWVTEWSVTGQTGWGHVEGRIFTRPGHTRSYSGSPYGSHVHWQVFCRFYDGGAGSNVSASEIEFRDAAGADQATGGTATASSSFSGSFLPANAFADDGGTTFWASGGEGGQAHIEYEFAAPVEVKAVAWRTRTDSDPTQAVHDYSIRYSDDGTHWSTAWFGTTSSGWSLGENRVFTDPNYI